MISLFDVGIELTLCLWPFHRDIYSGAIFSLGLSERISFGLNFIDYVNLDYNKAIFFLGVFLGVYFFLYVSDPEEIYSDAYKSIFLGILSI